MNRIYFVIEDSYKPVKIKAVFNDTEKAEEFVKNERNYRIKKIMKDIYLVIEYERFLDVKAAFDNIEEATKLSKKKSSYHIEIYSILPLSEKDKKYWEKEKKHWDDLKIKNLDKIKKEDNND